MQVNGNKIVFPTHAIVCDPEVADPEYMRLIADTIEAEANEPTMREHARVLRNHNNDGSWGIKRIPVL
jgi:hypothetical protein